MHTGLLQILFKPLSDLSKTLNPVLRLPASGEIMILIMEEYELGLHSFIGKEVKQLIAFTYRAPVILIGMDDESRS